MIDITTIVNASILLLSAIITAVLIPYIRGKMSADGFAKLIRYVGIGVTAAEQIYKGIKQGAEKKAYVLKFLQKNGITYSEDVIDNAIESAVNQLKTTKTATTVNIPTIQVSPVTAVAATTTTNAEGNGYVIANNGTYSGGISERKLL